jgi:hypothetical protein
MSQPHVLTPERTHYLLTRHVIETGHAPDVLRLAELANCSQQETENSLQALADMHGVILEPNSLRIWSLHPFAMVPSAFSVTSGARGWWANCAWCSLGIGAALGEDFSVLTTDGAEGESLQFDVAGSKSSRAKIVMHFPYPPGRWWDNPYCPCGNIVFFSSENRIDAWCARHGRPKGAILPFQTSMDLARLWFGDYAESDWRRKTPQQAMDIFRELKLDPAFWNIPGTFR